MIVVVVRNGKVKRIYAQNEEIKPHIVNIR